MSFYLWAAQFILKRYVSGCEYTGVSGGLFLINHRGLTSPRSHGVLFFTCTICHCFLITQNRHHGCLKEVSTVVGTVLVKTVTVGGILRHRSADPESQLSHRGPQRPSVPVLKSIAEEYICLSVWYVVVTAQSLLPCLGRRKSAASLKWRNRL